MRTKVVFSTVGCILIAAASAFSQTVDTRYPMTWADCTALASKNNPDLIASKHSFEASKAAYYGSFNGFFPQLNLSHSYSDSDSNDNGATWQTRGSLSLNVFDMSQIASFRAARASLLQAEASVRQASSVLRYNLRRAFNQLYFVQKNVEVSGSIVSMREAESQLVALRYESGVESKGNMLRAKAQLLQAQADLAQSVRDLRTAQRVLCQQLGLDDFAALVTTSTLDAALAPDFPKDENLLLSRRPDISLQEASVKSAEAGLSQSRSALWPNLSANYSKSSSGTSEFSGAFQSNWGLALNYPIFGGGPTAVYYYVSAAKSNLEKAKQNLRSVREQALVDIETSWSNFAGAVDQSKVQTALLGSARQRYDESNIRYDSGLLTYDSWEIIASDRVSQERQAIQAQLSVLNAEAAWQKSLGKQLEE